MSSILGSLLVIAIGMEYVPARSTAAQFGVTVSTAGLTVIVWVTVGQRYARRKKLFCAIIDAVEVKTCAELSPRDIQRENPEFRNVEEVVGLLSRIYGREVSVDDVATVIYFSPIEEYEL